MSSTGPTPDTSSKHRRDSSSSSGSRSGSSNSGDESSASSASTNSGGKIRKNKGKQSHETKEHPNDETKQSIVNSEHPYEAEIPSPEIITELLKDWIRKEKRDLVKFYPDNKSKQSIVGRGLDVAAVDMVRKLLKDGCSIETALKFTPLVLYNLVVLIGKF